MRTAAPLAGSRILTQAPDDIRLDDGLIVGTQVAHVAHRPDGQTIVIITLTGGDPDRRAALADRVVGAARDTLTMSPPVNRLAAVFAHLSRPPVEPLARTLLSETPVAGTILPAEDAAPEPASVSPYEAPFLLAPLTRRAQ